MKREGKNKEDKKECGPAQMRADERINTDPDGSWTGVPTEFPYEMPVQDVDDL